MLTVTTLAFATAGSAYLLPQSYALGGGVNPGQVRIFGMRLVTAHQYYYFALTVFALCFLLCANVRRSGFARTLIAVRDNEPNARAFTVHATTVKVQGNLVAGFVAGIGGAVFAYSLSNVGADAFPAGTSLDVVVMSVLGGISSLAGPIIGCAWVIGLPQLPQLGNLGLAATYLGATGIILWRPSGLIGFADYPRRRLASWLARRHGIDLDTAPEVRTEPGSAIFAQPGRVDAVRVPPQPTGTTTSLLQAHNLVKHFGGVRAVNGVSLEVHAHETLGLIGPNGAGKTTTFELLGGFTTPDAGTVSFRGRDVSHLGPEGRAELGLIRSFQDAALFPTMTVSETVMLAQERTWPSSFLGAAVGLGGRTERVKAARARELIAVMGLMSYADKQIRELSTGTRRITEIACLVALEPTCLLLDEPSSGIAQRETEALGALIADLKRQLGLTLVVIEHDIPLIMGISDRIVVMADGAVICDGTPSQVRDDPQVIDAYLGGSIDAIERSGART
jgi:ABC-type branched-subunit amino acid transport system ATPase component